MSEETDEETEDEEGMTIELMSPPSKKRGKTVWEDSTLTEEDIDDAEPGPDQEDNGDQSDNEVVLMVSVVSASKILFFVLLFG